MIAAILTLILAVGCRAIAELQQHGKLKWSKDPQGFWGGDSWIRKYKGDWRKESDGNGWDYSFEDAPTTWYYKLFNLKYKERFPLSATIDY